MPERFISALSRSEPLVKTSVEEAEFADNLSRHGLKISKLATRTAALDFLKGGVGFLQRAGTCGSNPAGNFRARNVERNGWEFHPISSSRRPFIRARVPPGIDRPSPPSSG